ncbi:hypothetical protein FDC27_13625 [Clostridium botulinum]|nr:hypothetical protein [Clostridium botulinum]NFL58267.1 hypothetical protein [Clostridium botulinum]NFL62949.1 hypothetical protein [Clostridium botulinum]NFO67964.1 hypothetical protein [Clostridium botulinum]
MIRKYCEIDFLTVNSAIKKDIFQNVYLYIDSKFYGFNNNNISTYLLCDGNEIKTILYQYYNSLQLFIIKQLTEQEILEICKYIKENDIVMVTGKVDIVRQMSIKLKEFTITEGKIFTSDIISKSNDEDVELATIRDCKDIAKLICSDFNIGGHYEINTLQTQLEERMKIWGCKNVIIKKQNKIFAHMATYAECKEMSILGGLVTEENSRGLGYGRKVLNKLKNSVLSDKKTPILYCYEKKLQKWYMSLGWTVIAECGKIEKRSEIKC